MPSTKLTVPYTAMVAFRAGRAKSDKRMRVAAAVDIEIPHLDPAGVTQVASGSFKHLWAPAPSAVDVIASEGRTLSPFSVTMDRPKGGDPLLGRLTVEKLAQSMASPRTSTYQLFPKERPWSQNEDGHPLPADVGTIVADERPGIEARIRAIASTLRIHDGIVYCDRIEPVFNLAPYKPSVLAPTVTCEVPQISGYAFRLDREDAFREAMERVSRTGGFKLDMPLSPENAVELLVPEALRFREDVHNARVASNYALRSLGEQLAWLPVPMFADLTRLAEARDGLSDDSRSPDDVAAILGSIAEAVEALPSRSVQLKHFLAIGRDMIAMSVRSPRAAEFDAEDTEALLAFGR